MGWPLTWRKSADADIAVWKAEVERLRQRAAKAERIAKTEVAARRTIAELYADLCDSHGLPVPAVPDQPDGQRAAQAMDRFDEAQARNAADRIADLQKAVTAAREETAAEKRRADQLQARLDDAVGLKPYRIEDSRWWQPGYNTIEDSRWWQPGYNTPENKPS